MRSISTELAAVYASIDRTDLSGELTDTPSQLNRVCELYAQLLYESQVADHTFKVTEATERLRIQSRLAQQGKKANKETLDAMVTVDDSVQSAYLEKLKADKEKRRLGDLVETIKTKSKLLMTLGGLERSELENGIPKTISMASNWDYVPETQTQESKHEHERQTPIRRYTTPSTKPTTTAATSTKPTATTKPNSDTHNKNGTSRK